MKVLSVESKRLFFILRVIVYSLKIFGLAPFSVSIEKPAPINPYDCSIEAFFFSKFGLAYNILLSIWVIVAPVFFPPNFFSSMKIDADGSSMANIRYAIWAVKRTLSSITTCIVLIYWGSRQNKAASIMNRLLEVDVRLYGLKNRPFDKRAIIFLAIHGILNAILWVTHWARILVYLNVEKSTEFFRRIPEGIIYWFIVEYLTIVGLVSRDLETVNEYLLDFEQFGNYSSRPPVRNGNVLPVVISVSPHSSDQIASLRQLRNVRTTLSELCGEISDFFSLSILFCMACCFIPIFELLYYITQVGNDLPTGFAVCLTVVLVLQYIYPVVSLTLNVTRTVKEAEITGRIVHKLLTVARTEELKAELEQFSLQLLHEKINFTAHGLFTLDSTLLHSMLGGVASYAIILIQFRSSVCDGNGNGKNTSAAM